MNSHVSSVRFFSKDLEDQSADNHLSLKTNDAGYVEGLGIGIEQLKKEVSELPDTYAIERAISNAAEAAKGAEGLTLIILNQHLKYLCEMQRDFIRVEFTCTK
ncbi:hypothetical protein AAEJ42_02070 [Shewanella algae]|uniref:hypothetical protein n=1 Tax=Shewanella algae TaxID=38313 RepID=UPI00313B919C